MAFMKSPLKYVGSKYRSLDFLFDKIPQGKQLVEPFVGGGSVFLNYDYGAMNAPIIINDQNKDIITFYEYLRFTPDMAFDELIEQWHILFENKNTESDYYKIREEFNLPDLDLKFKVIDLLYLNRCGFRGLMRYNSKGKFNVPYGNYKKPYMPEKELRHLRQVLKKRMVFIHSNHSDNFFYEVQHLITNNTVIYCDPPYDQTFSSYTKNDFDRTDRGSMLVWLREIKEDTGCQVFISDNANEYTHELYKDNKAMHCLTLADGANSKRVEILVEL